MGEGGEMELDKSVPAPFFMMERPVLVACLFNLPKSSENHLAVVCLEENDARED